MRPQDIFTGQLMVGQRIHCALHGGTDGTVVSIHGQQRPATCRTLSAGICVTGGNAELDIIWDNGTQSLRIPESLVRGSVQWRVYGTVVTAEEIAATRANLAVQTARRKAAADEAETLYQEQCTGLRASYPHLKQAGDEPDSFTRAIANIRLSLKNAFPKVKFSVRKQYYGSIYVRWSDGPTSTQVTAIVDQFKEGHFNGMEDIYEYHRKPWTTVFGGAKYISTSREVSDALLQFALDKLYEQLPVNLAGVPKPAVKVLRGFGNVASIPFLNIDVGEGARAIAECFDQSAGQFVMPRHFRNRWLTEPLIAAQQAVDDSRPDTRGGASDISRIAA